MHIDKYGQRIFTELDLCSLMMQHPKRELKFALVDEMVKFNPDLELENVPELIKYYEPTSSIPAFDRELQSHWYMPPEYMKFDIAKWVLEQCKTDAELQRAGEELIEFTNRDMLMLLRYMKYLVDIMRENNVIWGVGRGSSTASYVLYLIGIHRINSMYYDLDISEFLK